MNHINRFIRKCSIGEYNLSSVVLFVFNRPDHVKQSLEALEECYLAADSVMYIFSDTSEDEEKRIEQVREYIKKKEKAYKKNNICFTGPRWVLSRARESALLKTAKLFEVDEFVDTVSTFIPRDRDDIRKRYGIKEKDILVLNVAPSSDPRKGANDFLFYAKQCENKKITFMNVGNQIEKECLPEGYIGVPFVTNQVELSRYYSAADILFCTSYADTMPNVCLDALSCGTPVMGYNITGVPYVADEPLGYFFNPENKKEIMDFINTLHPKNEETISLCREYATKRYSLETYYSRQLAIYDEMFNSGEKI